MKIVAWAKSHPFIAAGIGLVLFLAILWLAGDESSERTTYAPGSGPSNDSQMAQINAAIAAQSQQVSAAREVALSEQTMNIELAKIAQGIAQGEQAIRSQEISASQQVMSLQSTLSARVAEAEIASGVQKDQIASTTSIETTRLFANALVQQSQIAANVQMAAVKCTGFKALFGC